MNNSDDIGKSQRILELAYCMDIAHRVDGNRIEMIQNLLCDDNVRLQINSSIEQYSNNSPLMLAISYRNEHRIFPQIEIVRLLLQNGACPDTYYFRRVPILDLGGGFTGKYSSVREESAISYIIQTASDECNGDIIDDLLTMGKMLLEYGANVDTYKSEKKYAVLSALDMADYLIYKRDNPKGSSISSRNDMVIPFKSNPYELVELIAKRTSSDWDNIKPEAYNKTVRQLALEDAVRSGNIELIKTLLENGADKYIKSAFSVIYKKNPRFPIKSEESVLSYLKSYSKEEKSEDNKVSAENRTKDNMPKGIVGFLKKIFN